VTETPPKSAVTAPPVVAVGAVAVVDGALLLVRRARPPEAGSWSVPGGRVDAGETVRGAVVREVLEETGLTVGCGRFVGWAERLGPDGHFVILDFEVTGAGDGDPVPGSDAAAVAWVPLAEVATLALVEGLVDFLVGHGVLG